MNRDARTPTFWPTLLPVFLALASVGIALSTLAIPSVAIKVTLLVVAVVLIAATGAVLAIVVRTPRRSMSDE